MQVDAIVNAANKSLLGGGGVNGTIHRAAGPKLLEECKKLGGCEVGEAKITAGYSLASEYVIHTVGPIYCGGKSDEAQQLALCYKNALELAKKRGVESIAFPLILQGRTVTLKKEAIRVAINTIKEFLAENDMYIYLVIFEENTVTLSTDLHNRIESFLERKFTQEKLHDFPPVCASLAPGNFMVEKRASEPFFETENAQFLIGGNTSKNSDLEILLQNIDESFSEMLLRKIDEQGLTDSECYKKANIDAVETASNYGIAPERAVNYCADSVGTGLVFASVGGTVSKLRADESINDDWAKAIEEDYVLRSK